ncbi:hypothetical protein DPPLL_22900 [Desulfofustis limnaeus]|uniref:VWFA domain-containing protein n=1 Tax=Desulfofustis limnaeus TaxID=2740163 RepID=A0ABN6M6R6_9BACT|nr:hypothetical protein DPPLL_22900 [Desulfofustis limnaeus]
MCVEDLDLGDLSLTGGRRGRTKAASVMGSSGRYIRALPVRDQEREFDLAADATIRAALLRQGPNAKTGSLQVAAADLRKKAYRRPRQTLVVFVVDSSDSMGDDGTYARIKAAKGAVLAILGKAYQRRHRVGLVVFREETAAVVLQPTTSLSLAQRQLRTLPTGGATPFADGLMKAWRLVRTERLKDPHIRPLLVILSDGEANVPYDPQCRAADIEAELLAIAGRIGQDEIASLVIDTRPLSSPAPEMRRLAEALGGTYQHISTLKAGGMVRAVVSF